MEAFALFTLFQVALRKQFGWRFVCLHSGESPHSVRYRDPQRLDPFQTYHLPHTIFLLQVKRRSSRISIQVTDPGYRFRDFLQRTMLLAFFPYHHRSLCIMEWNNVTYLSTGRFYSMKELHERQVTAAKIDSSNNERRRLVFPSTRY